MTNLTSNHPFPRLTHLGDIPIEIFLKEYWQKKPLLIRQCFPNFESPVSAEELAGFALEDEVNSRLVVEHPTPGENQWEVTHGPLPELIFSKLPERNWTLLVQHVDALDPQVNQLLNAFRFIPNWRLDDIMVSYAVDGGGVGPHFDYYDVFLLQAQGKRRWRIGQTCSAQTSLLPDQPMKILAEFQQADEWLLEPGDMLYLPPMLAHWGVAVGECMTYSVGFRAPSHADILLDFAQEMASRTTEDQRYADPGLAFQQHPGEISPQVVANIRDILQHCLSNNTQLATWLGETMTRAKTDLLPDIDTISPGQLHNNVPFRLSPFSRSAFVAAEETQLFIDGVSYPCSKPFAARLSSGEAARFSTLEPADQRLAIQLAELALLVPALD